jgi:hypothetical protein
MFFDSAARQNGVEAEAGVIFITPEGKVLLFLPFTYQMLFQ